MGATLTGKTSSRTRHGLIALIAVRRARAMRERREREEAERASKAVAEAQAPRKKRGWFR